VGVVEVPVEVCFATVYQLVANILDIREAVDSLVVGPSLFPEIELVRAHACFQPRRLDLVYFRGRAVLSSYIVGAHMGVEEGHGDTCVLIGSDVATLSEGARHVDHLRRLSASVSSLGIIKEYALPKRYASRG